MILICAIQVIAFHFVTKTEVEGFKISETNTKYYVDFSKDLNKNNWDLLEGRDGKQLVDKNNCVKK